MRKKRETNIECLRMLAGMGVIILHFNYFPAGGGALETAVGLNYYLLMFLEILCVSAVNIFILISGYFGCDSKTIKFQKLVEILLQTICFRFAMTLLGCLLRHEWNIGQLIYSLIPANYYVTLYIVLMLIAPFLNKLINSLSKKDFSIFVILLFLLFSVYTILIDVIEEITDSPMSGLSSIGINGSMAGYSIINFVLVYVLGVFLRKCRIIHECKMNLLLISLVGTIFIIFIWR